MSMRSARRPTLERICGCDLQAGVPEVIVQASGLHTPPYSRTRACELGCRNCHFGHRTELRTG
eukprot:6175636-Pleurochrysis_carterae.AAC.1